MSEWRTKTGVIKRTIDGVECVFYVQHLYSDSLILIKCGTEKATTKQIKSCINNIIEIISNAIEINAIIDDRLQKYSTALTVFKAIKAIFSRNNQKPPSIDDAKIAIDIAKEIALTAVKDPVQRATLKSVSFTLKLLFDIGGGDE